MFTLFTSLTPYHIFLFNNLLPVNVCKIAGYVAIIVDLIRRRVLQASDLDLQCLLSEDSDQPAHLVCCKICIKYANNIIIYAKMRGN